MMDDYQDLLHDYDDADGNDDDDHIFLLLLVVFRFGKTCWRSWKGRRQRSMSG